MNLHTLSRLDRLQSRSISPENVTGAKGAGGMAEHGPGETQARDLGPGWKISPLVHINPGTTFEVADIQGPGVIEQIWMTPAGHWRHSILRIYWDGQEHPSVECPVGDFFACGWGQYAHRDAAGAEARRLIQFANALRPVSMAHHRSRAL